MVLIDNGGAGAAAVQLLPPPDDLAALVEHLWIQPGALTDDWRVVPDASPHLLVTIDRISQNHGPLPVWLVGPRSAAISVNMTGGAGRSGCGFGPAVCTR